jgi:hypothetical protein
LPRQSGRSFSGLSTYSFVSVTGIIGFEREWTWKKNAPIMKSLSVILALSRSVDSGGLAVG